MAAGLCSNSPVLTLAPGRPVYLKCASIHLFIYIHIYILYINLLPNGPLYCLKPSRSSPIQGISFTSRGTAAPLGKFPRFLALCTELSDARGRGSTKMEKRDKHLVPFAPEKCRSLSPAGVSALNSGGGCAAFSGGAMSLMQSPGSFKWDLGIHLGAMGACFVGIRI